MDGTGHLLTPKIQFSDLVKSNGKPTLRRIGNTKASTFPGFCGSHDTSLFREIEQAELVLSREAAFKFAFRAICLELFNKERALEDLEELRHSDAGTPLQKQLAIQSYLAASFMGHRKAIEEVTAIKQRYDDIYRRSAWEDLHYRAVWFDKQLPMAFSTGLLPEYSFTGTRLQNLSDLTRTAEHVTMTLTVGSNYSVVVFAWAGDGNESALRFTESFLQVPDAQKADALVSTALELTENVYISPVWWNSLAPETQQPLLQLMPNGTPQALHSGTAMKSRFGLITADVVRVDDVTDSGPPR